MASNDSSSTRRWRPGTFEDPKLDQAIKTIYDSVYGLEQQALISTVPGQALASGSTQVTGVGNSIATGLDTVNNVVASIDNEATGLNEFVSARPSPNAKGAIDLFVWTTAAAPSGLERTIRWMATGKRRETQ